MCKIRKRCKKYLRRCKISENKKEKRKRKRKKPPQKRSSNIALGHFRWTTWVAYIAAFIG